ncbi:MAG TPA: XdhC family protein [Phototrophicaceae bacterium]|nr:XdhC family protein [Phototrophicaceae bacterium]
MSEDRAVFEALVAAQAKGEPVALATVVSVQGSVPRHEGSKMLVRADGSIISTVGGGTMEQRVIQEALAALKDGKTRLLSYSMNDINAGDPGVCGGTVQVFVEPIGAAPALLVIGVGHVGKALAELGKWAGYRVVVSDDREEFCNPDYLPGMDEYAVCKPGKIAECVEITPLTYIAAVTRGLTVDVDLVPALLQTEAAYIGVIGSRRRWALTVKALKEERGLTNEQLARVHAPIGLEIRAETPQEIAVSILAEIIMRRRGGDGQPMQWLGEVAPTEE